MKKLFLWVLLGAFILVGCGQTESKFTIKVSGTSGLKFSGSYMTVRAGGASTSKSVEGTVPAEYNLRGIIVSCTFQKQSEKGNLRVDIFKDGTGVSQSETSAPYGVVSVATP